MSGYFVNGTCISGSCTVLEFYQSDFVMGYFLGLIITTLMFLSGFVVYLFLKRRKNEN